MLTNMGSIPTLRSWIIDIENIISLDVDALTALPVQPNVSSDALRVVKTGAKLLKTSPRRYDAKISQVLGSWIKALTTSSAHTPGLNYGHDSVSHAALESNDSQTDRNPQTRSELTAMNSDHVKVHLAISYAHDRSRC